MVSSYKEMFAKAFYRDLHNSDPKAFSFSFFIDLLALSRVYFALGGFGGPEKDQIVKVRGRNNVFRLSLL